MNSDTALTSSVIAGAVPLSLTDVTPAAPPPLLAVEITAATTSSAQEDGGELTEEHLSMIDTWLEELDTEENSIVAAAAAHAAIDTSTSTSAHVAEIGSTDEYDEEEEVIVEAESGVCAAAVLPTLPTVGVSLFATQPTQDNSHDNNGSSSSNDVVADASVAESTNQKTKKKSNHNSVHRVLNRQKNRVARSLLNGNKTLVNQERKKLRDKVALMQKKQTELQAKQDLTMTLVVPLLSTGSQRKPKSNKKQQQQQQKQEHPPQDPFDFPAASASASTSASVPTASILRHPPPPPHQQHHVSMPPVSRLMHRPLPLPCLPIWFQRRFLAERTRSWHSRTGDVVGQRLSVAAASTPSISTSYHPDILSICLPTKRPILLLDQKQKKETETVSRALPPLSIQQALTHACNHAGAILELEQVEPLAATIRHCCVSIDGSWIARAWSDSLLTVEHVQSDVLLHHATLETHGAQVVTSAFSSMATFLLTGTTAGHVSMWDVQRGRLVSRYQTTFGSSAVWDVQWCERDTYILAACEDGSCGLWRSDQLAPLRLFIRPGGAQQQHLGAATQVRLHPSYRYVLVGYDDGSAHLWDCHTVQTVREFGSRLSSSMEKNKKKTSKRITDMAFSSDGSQLVVADVQGGLCLWDVASGHNIESFGPSHSGNILETVRTSVPGSVESRYRVHWAHYDTIIAHVHPAGIVQCLDTHFRQPLAQSQSQSQSQSQAGMVSDATAANAPPSSSYALHAPIRIRNVNSDTKPYAEFTQPQRVMCSAFTTRNVLSVFSV